ncbi:MAG: DUF3696 domain-containing protein [Bacteroidetes bacterium]|nr:DUF3696 domain-containing protein [Bacteroidota bacterium]MCW5896775.1 DUF3696 domain-containing protein [Bacteroidota bacterium]
MIKSLRLGNFKAFAETQTIPIRPLTLIFGANSSGKSSIIHSLLLANEATKTGKLDISHTQVGGDAVDLGGFRQYIHRTDSMRRLSLCFEMIAPESFSVFHAGSTIRFEILIGLEHKEEMVEKESTDPRTGKPVTIRVPTGNLVPVGIPRVESFSIAVDGKDIAQVSSPKNGMYKLNLIASHPLIVELIQALVLMSTTVTVTSDHDVKQVQAHLVEFMASAGVFFKGILPAQLGFAGEGPEEGPDRIIPVGRSTRTDDINAAIDLFLPGKLSDMVLSSTKELESWLSSIVYLGPLRSYPERHLAFSKELDANWQAGGGYAWDIVRRNFEVRNMVNNWLGPDRLSTPYALVVRDLIADTYLSEELDAMFDEYNDRLLERIDLSQVEMKKATKEEIEAFFREPSRGQELARKLAQTSPDQIRDLVLIDLRTDTPVSHRDVGIGISQALPVLVYAFANEKKTIAIEQPEIHLHPALQAELGDVFIESALGERKNTFILETHSEHLILRILRRIRESSEKKVPDITPNDVQVLYVQPGANGSAVIPLDITPEGDFVQKWPGGFFAERAEELF